MASVRSKNGKLFIDYRINGIRYREFLKIDDNRDNRKIAEKRRKEIEYELSSGVFNERLKRLDSTGKLLEEGYKEFLLTKRAMKQSTLNHYKNAFENPRQFAFMSGRHDTVSWIFSQIDGKSYYIIFHPPAKKGEGYRYFVYEEI